MSIVKLMLLCSIVHPAVTLVAGEPKCKADVVFIIDSSGSISRSNWNRLRVFLSQSVRRMGVGPTRIHVAALTYSTDATVEFRFDSLRGPGITAENYTKLLGNITVHRGYTFIDKGLQKAQSDIFTTESGMRDDAHKVAMVIIDGKQTTNQGPYTEPITAGQALKDIGVHIHVVGVGQRFDENLTVIATDTNKSVSRIEHFKDLDPSVFLDDLGRICETVPKVACRPVLNVTAKSSGSTSIAVSWLLVAPHPSCGDLVGFRVIYTQISARRRRSLDQADMQETFGEYSGNIREIFVNATVRSVKLLKLSKYAKHCVQVKVVLDPGRGDRPSPCLYVWTDEDVPSKAPNKTSFRNDAGSNRFAWEPVSQESWHGVLLGYLVVYRVVQVYGRNASSPKTFEEFVGPEVTHVTIDGPQARATYCVQVAAATKKGVGPRSVPVCSETCSCDSHLTADNQSLQASGLITIHVLEQLFQHVCSTCVSNVTLSLVQSNADITISTVRQGSPQKQSTAEYSFAALWEVKGVAIVKPKLEESVYPRLLFESVHSSWPSIAIILLLILLAATILWMLEGYHPEGLGQGRISGRGEAVWWSVITISTVGYGDRVAVTRVGRTFTVVWFLVGTVVLHLYAAVLTATLTVNVVRWNILKPDVVHKVVVLANSTEERAAMTVLRSKIEIDARLDTIDELISVLRDKRKPILVDMFFPRRRKDIWHDHTLEINLIPGTFVQGLRLHGNAAKMADGIRDYAKDTDLQIGLIRELMEHEKHELDKAMQEKEAAINFFAPGNLYFQLALAGCAILVMGATCCGLAYEAFRLRSGASKSSRYSHRVTLRRTGGSSDVTRTMKEGLTECVTQFHHRTAKMFTQRKQACLDLALALDRRNRFLTSVAPTVTKV